ncbi:hypothetical protein ORD22_11280 [Sporosarcina sp. GW1-11]|uniref:hypothetical protein n=1 Tax=Sporosarcina sp. GW1-11 TaxID=2899126 RepID=UPI00294D3563|nr:hypothetical protein [Sporosarcina sp. GW1-11]MDV6378797.1 hypothetical protein [Sporosarcina sp. GW1-11]
MIKSGKRQEAADEFAEVFKQIEEIHPLHPLYTYKPTELGSKIVFEHQPLNAEVAKQYPIKYRGRFSIIDKDMKLGETINEFLSRKHVRQEKVQIDVKYIETWIGKKKIIDPLSLEQNAIKEGDWYMLPAPLPPPIRAKLVSTRVEDNVIIDYMELRTTKINRMDSIAVISNEHQKDSPVLFSLIFKNLSNSDPTINRFDIDMNFKIRESFERTVMAEIIFLTFLKCSISNGNMILSDLEKGVNFFEAQPSTLDTDYDAKTVDERLSLLNDLRLMEHYFCVKFHLPDNMKDEDFRKFEILKAIMEEKEVVTGLKNFNATFNGIDGLKRLIDDAEEKSIKITADSSDQLNINLFGAEINNVNMSYTIEDIKVKNPERIKEKIRLFDESEIIKVEFIPGEKNKLSTRYSVDLKNGVRDNDEERNR